MRYETIPCDDGRWFIFDKDLDVVFAYVGNELLARKVTRMLNQDAAARLDDFNSTNLH